MGSLRLELIGDGGDGVDYCLSCVLGISSERVDYLVDLVRVLMDFGVDDDFLLRLSGECLHRNELFFVGVVFGRLHERMDSSVAFDLSDFDDD